MKDQACLITGPLLLETVAGTERTIGGAGFYAAAAAAPFAITQLWARGGEDFDGQRRSVLSARHIDEAGIEWDGPSNGEPALPECTPTAAEDLTAALLIGLGPDEGRRAFEALSDLGPSTARTLGCAPMSSDAEWIRYCCQRANLMVLEVGDALAATGSTDPLTAARTLQDWGAKVVCLSAGVLGGLACYQQKACTWPAHPAPLKDDTGVFATFAGTLIGCCAENGKCDWRVLKRAVAVASAVAAECGKGYGPKRLLGLDRGDYTDRFNQLRRNGKF